MIKFLVSTAVGAMLVLSATSSSHAAGDYYEAASKDGARSVDRLQTNSTSYGYSTGSDRALFGNTSRDNHQMGDATTVDSGDYYQGATRPH